MNQATSAFPERQALSVSQLSRLVKDLIEGCDLLSSVAVRGEISNLTVHASGHLYFSLKDEESVISAVMFRSAASKLKFAPKNGMKVVVFASVSTYAKMGRYQLYVTAIEPDGMGALYLAFEQLKSKLAAEGLFDRERKKPLPKIPSRIGIITSPTGAAVRDMIRILGARFPYAEVLLYPALVQGIDAPQSLRMGLAFFNRKKSVDLIIIGRGGGSMEDLFAFNDEALARDVAVSQIPVISAVGHETDFTICDFVADLRAATPSNAAELAVPETAHMLSSFQNVVTKMRLLCERKTELFRRRLKALAESRVLTDPKALYESKRKELQYLQEGMVHGLEKRLLSARAALSEKAALLDGISPLKTLARGYAVATDEKGRVIRDSSKVNIGDELHLRLHTGALTVEVKDKEQRKEETV